MNKKRILLAEDEAITAKDLKTRLVQLGYEVPAVVSSGEDAIRIAAEMYPDLVLMDITLTGQMSGIEAADEIRKTLAIPVVFLTAHTDVETIDRAKISEPFGYLPKHVDNTSLAITIDFALFKSDADAKIRKSEERYRSVVEDQTELICRYREDGSLSFVNGAYERYYKKSRPELINSNFIPEIPEPDLSIIKQKLAGITRDNPVAIFEHRIVMPEGEERWQRWTHRGIYAVDGRLIEYQAVGNDITERKQLEDEKEHLASFPELNPNPIIEVSASGNIIFHNNAAIDTLRMLGIKEDVNLFLPEDISEILQGLELKNRSRVYRVKKINEIFFGEDIYLSPEFNSARIYVDDITERKRAEEALKKAHTELEARVAERTLELTGLNKELESEKQQIKIINRLLKLFVGNTSRKKFLDDAVKIIQEWCDCRCLGIRILDQKGNIPYESSIGFNQEFLESESLLSVNSDQCACTRVIREAPEPQDLPAMTEYGSFYSNNAFEFVDGLTDEGKSRFRGICIRNGFRSLAIIPVFFNDKVLGAIHLADEKEGVVDTNKVKFLETLSPVIGEAIYRFNAEEELRRSQEQLRNLTAHLQAVREEERTTIAREIHDELGQIMTALKFDLSWIRNNYGDHETLNKKTGSMMALMDEMIQTVRRIITELRPGILDHLGVSAAMEWHAEEFQKITGIPCDVVIKPEEIILSKDLSINMFRIFQEILTNIMRHSEATFVNVLLKQQDGMLVLKVEDNGKGITAEEISKPASFGIMGMRERVNHMRGSLKIGNIPKNGTTIEVIVPIES